MATEYTRIYTYTGQTSWTSGTRSVPLSKYAISGDTTHTIAQITSITYKHRHSASSHRTYTLSGRLVLSDGTTVDSEPVKHTIGSNDVVWFTNIWNHLPTPQQWAMVANVQTVFSDTGSAESDGTLTWKSHSSDPNTIVITFLDTPPVVYSPKIDLFDVQRMDANGLLADDGSYIATSLKLSTSGDAPLNEAKLILYVSEKSGEFSSNNSIDLSGRISELITGLNMNTSLIPGEFSPGMNWYFAVEFSIGDETAFLADMVQMKTVSMHLSKFPTGGVAIGMYSTSTDGNPKFETAHRAYFYNGAVGLGFDSDYNETEYAGRDPDGRQRYFRELTFTLGSKADTNYYSEVIAENIYRSYIMYGMLIRSSDGKAFPLNFYRASNAYIDTAIDADNRIVSRGASIMAGEITVGVMYTKK